MKRWYDIKAAAQGAEFAEVHILDEIGFWGVSAKEFLADFRGIAANKVKLYISSPGGSVFEALAMFNGMRATGKEIEVHILGIAASAASYVAMVGSKIVMPANTMMFVHNPINGVYGNADDMREMADILDKIGATLTATYAKRWKGEEKMLAEILAAETYLTAAECLEYGFCDEVTDEIAAKAVFDVSKLPDNVKAIFKAAVEPPVDPALDPPASQPDPTVADQIKAFAVEAGLESLAPVFVTDPQASTVAGGRILVARAAEIKALAAHAGLPDHAEPLIRARTDLPAARVALAAALAANDESVRIDTAARAKNSQAAHPGAGWSPTSLWADIKAMNPGASK